MIPMLRWRATIPLESILPLEGPVGSNLSLRGSVGGDLPPEDLAGDNATLRRHAQDLFRPLVELSSWVARPTWVSSVAMW